MHPDFSPQAIRRAILAQSLQHPAVLYPAAAGILGGVGLLLIASSPLLSATAVAGGGVAAGAWLWNYLLRKDVLAGRYLEKAHQAVIAQREHLMQSLENELAAAGSPESVRQMQRFKEKIVAFETVLAGKFDRRELTFGRFLGVAEQVYLSGIDNLRAIALARRAALNIDEQYIRGRLKALRDDPATSPAEDREVAGLEQQLQTRQGHMQRVDELLATNEEALAQLDSAIDAITRIETQGRRAATDMESAMRDLVDIAARAKDYSAS